MCINCVRAYGIDEVGESTPEMVEAIELVCWVYAQDGYGVGGPLHIQLDDYNLEDRFLEDSAIDWWEKPVQVHERTRGSLMGEVLDPEHKAKFLRLLKLLRAMTLAERAATVWRAKGFPEVVASTATPS